MQTHRRRPRIDANKELIDVKKNNKNEWTTERTKCYDVTISYNRWGSRGR